MTAPNDPSNDYLSLIPVSALTNADPSKMLRHTTTQHGFNLVNGDTSEVHHEALAELWEEVSERDDDAFLLDLSNRLSSMVTSVFPVVCTKRDGKMIVHVHALDGQEVADDVSLIIEAQRWTCAEIVIDTVATDVTGQLSDRHGDRYWQIRPVVPVSYPNKTYPTMLMAVDALNEVLVLHLMRQGLSVLSGTPLVEAERKVNRATFAMLGANPRERRHFADSIGDVFLDKMNALMGLFGRYWSRTGF
jgi:hypothetical protein